MNHGFLFASLAGLTLAIYQVMSKAELDRGLGVRPAEFATITSWVASLALFIVALTSNNLGISQGWLLPVIATGILNIGIQYANVKAKSLEDVSLVVPISSTTPAIVIITSIILLGEYPSALGWFGIWLMVVGTYVLNIQEFIKKRKRVAGRASWKDWLAPFLMLGKSIGVRFAFLSAILGTFALNFDALAFRHADIALTGACIFAIAGTGSFALAKTTGEFQKQRPAIKLWKILLIGLFLAMGIWFSGLAFLNTITPYVGTLKRLQIPFAILLAYLFLGEKLEFKERMAGGLIMAIGAVLIAVA